MGMIEGIAINRFLQSDETWDEAEAGMLKYVNEVLLVERKGARLKSLSMYQDSWMHDSVQVRRLNGMVELKYGETDAKVAEV